MRIIIVFICLLLTFTCFAEGQDGLEVFFYGLFFLSLFLHTVVGGFILLFILNLLEFKTSRKTILLSFSVALFISYLLYLSYPQDFIFFWVI